MRLDQHSGRPAPSPTGAFPFILGVGCQKGGTTWLFELLDGHPDCAMGPTKELHVFDSAFLTADTLQHATAEQLETVIRLAKAKLERRAVETRALSRQLSEAAERLTMVEDFRNYLHYFQKLRQSHPQAGLVGDITPAYAMLDGQHFCKIRELLLGSGYAPRVVFIMRDPVDRIYSTLRMIDRDLIGRGQQPARPAAERIGSVAGRQFHAKRTQYERTISALEEAFQSDNILYLFYESLFTDEAIERLFAFLGIRAVPPDFSRRANASPKLAPLDPAVIAAIRRQYRETYRFCAEKFGKATIRRLWGYDGSEDPVPSSAPTSR